MSDVIRSDPLHPFHAALMRDEQAAIVQDALVAHYALSQMGVPFRTQDGERPALIGRIAWLLLRYQDQFRRREADLLAEIAMLKTQRRRT